MKEHLPTLSHFNGRAHYSTVQETETQQAQAFLQHKLGLRRLLETLFVLSISISIYLLRNLIIRSLLDHYYLSLDNSV